MSTKRESGADAADAQNAPREKRIRVGPVIEPLKLPTTKVKEELLLCRAEMINMGTRSDAVALRQMHLVDELGAIQADFVAFKYEVRNQIAAELDNTISLLTAVLSQRQQQENTTREDAQADEREAMEN